MARLLTPAVLLATPVVLFGDLWLHMPDPSLRTVGSVDDVRPLFDAGREGPRLIVFFSSGCPACDDGSQALQHLLEEHSGPLTVLAVWEPIVATDLPPTAAVLDNLVDRRVVQLWDPDHRMSDALAAAERAHPGSIPQARLRSDTGILYDTVVIFRPGVRWEETLPAPDFLDGGLAAVLDQVHVRLDAYPRSGL